MNNLQPIGLRERREREYKEGEAYHFFMNGKKYFGIIDSVANNGIAYLRTLRESDGAVIWYMIPKMWLLTPNDLYATLN